MNDEKRIIIFFDGTCHLCNSFVDFMIRHDPQHLLFFASLQGETAAKILPLAGRDQLSIQLSTPLSTVLLLHEGKILEKSTAVIRALSLLGGWMRVFEVLLIIPLFIRDWIYEAIAKNRYRFFGKRDLCRIPTIAEKEYLLP